MFQPGLSVDLSARVPRGVLDHCSATFDADIGASVRPDRVEDGPAWKQIYNTPTPLHSGGLLTKVIWLVLRAALGNPPRSGFFVWWKRQH